MTSDTALPDGDALERARRGDIRSFHALYAVFKDELRSYLYRLLADRDDADDLAHDTFVRAFEKIGTFEAQSSLKTWLFSIATHLALDVLRRRHRWPVDILDVAREEAVARADVRQYLERAHASTPHGTFEVVEHVDFCFTCISKTLPIEGQVVLPLRGVYRFRSSEVAHILGTGEAAVKHHLRHARQTMMRIFDDRCALINQQGPCHQCSQLNGWLNPKQMQQQALISVDMVKAATHAGPAKLFVLRERLVRGIDPLRASGSDLHEAFSSLHRYCAGEVETLKPIGSPHDAVR